MAALRAGHAEATYGDLSLVNVGGSVSGRDANDGWGLGSGYVFVPFVIWALATLATQARFGTSGAGSVIGSSIIRDGHTHGG